jgi:hypothetical protein
MILLYSKWLKSKLMSNNCFASISLTYKVCQMETPNHVLFAWLNGVEYLSKGDFQNFFRHKDPTIFIGLKG